MKKILTLVVGVIAVLGVGIAGFWLGGQRAEDGRLLAVVSAPKEPAKKILYYRNAMGLPDTSPVPKKDSMGMDYVPVFEGDVGEGNQIDISVEKVQKLGVKSEAAKLRTLDKTIRAVGQIEVDERRTYTIAPKFEGWIEKLYANTSGQAVGKGQPLFDVYSPELISALREYALAAQGEASLMGAGEEAKASMNQLAAASLARLKNWGISDEQIKKFNQEKDRPENKRNLTFCAPVSGIVLEKKAVQGMRFMPGEMLYQIADLSSVWVLAEVPEQDIGHVKTGSVAQVDIAAYPDKHFSGKVGFIYPTLDPATRTVQVRVELANHDGMFKPAMFASVELTVSRGEKSLAVPTSAVIDSGTRQIVLVQLAQGRFEPREVKLGQRNDNYVEVLEGVAEGELVVTSANFLIDAESNLKAALGGLGHVHGGGAAQATEQSNDQPDAEHAGHGAAEQHPLPRAGEGDKASLRESHVKSAVVGHLAQGTLDAINADGTVSITHEAIKTLGWPGMSMDFALANSSLAQGIQPGTAISFELVERKPGEYVITKLQARQPAPHEGR